MNRVGGRGGEEEEDESDSRFVENATIEQQQRPRPGSERIDEISRENFEFAIRSPVFSVFVRFL